MDTENSTASLSVGWIGAGRMGAAMATRLARAGADVAVWNRTRAKAEPLADTGAWSPTTSRRCGTATWSSPWCPRPPTSSRCSSETAACSPTRTTCPASVVDCSTVDTESSARMRAACDARDVAFLAAPVSGNGKVVRAGQLSLVVSGPEETYQRVAPLLRHIGRSATYVGEGDLARLVKICHNLMLGVVTQCMAEITVLAEKGGVSRAAFLDFLNNSVMGSMFTRYKSPAFVNLDYTPDVHPRPAAQGLRPGPRGGARA